MTPGISVALRKNEQEAYVHRRARELAASGRFSGWAGIIFELEYFEGFPLAPSWLNYGSMIEELNTACQRARSASGQNHQTISHKTDKHNHSDE
jgi:hypothetical protein